MVLSALETDPLISNTFGTLLREIGFVLIGRRRWVRRGPSGIRHVFSVGSDGYSYGPRWGLSLDFVPHIVGGLVRWHRTDKSARFDLSASYDMDVGHMTAFDGPVQFEQKSKLVAERAIALAEAFWSHMRDPLDVVAFCDELSEDSIGKSIGFYNFNSHRLTHAFCLAKVGRHEEARWEFEGFIARSDEREETLGKLRKVFLKTLPISLS